MHFQSPTRLPTLLHFSPALQLSGRCCTMSRHRTFLSAVMSGSTSKRSAGSAPDGGDPTVSGFRKAQRKAGSLTRRTVKAGDIGKKNLKSGSAR